MTTETSVPARSAVQAFLVQYIASVVDMSAEDVALDRSFTDLGIDSAEVVIMTGVMEEEFGFEIDAELPFNEPTITGILDALEKQGAVTA